MRLNRFAPLLTGLLLLSGCSTSDANSGPKEPGSVVIRLVIADGNIREPDVSCEGAGAYRFAHPEAPFEIQDASGQLVSSGSLPQGVAEPAWTLDLGDRRQPTVCVMMLEVPGVDSVADHSLVIDGRPPKAIKL